MYSIDDLSKMTLLSDRTIRNYIRDGRINGTKIDGKWMFSDEEIINFMEDKFVMKSIQIKRYSLIQDFLQYDSKKEEEICTIYDYPVNNKAESEKFIEKAISLINTCEGSNIQMSYSYSIKKKMSRFILKGTPNTVIEIYNKLLTYNGQI